MQCSLNEHFFFLKLYLQKKLEKKKIIDET